MTQHFLFSLGKVMPFFILILVGWFLRQSRYVAKDFFTHSNEFVFKVALPVNTFYSIACMQQSEIQAGRLLWFTFVSMSLCFIGSFVLAELLFRDKTIIGTLVQGSYRMNYLLLAAPLAASVAGPTAQVKTALLVVIVLPLCNIPSTVALLLRGRSNSRPTGKDMLQSIVKNPMVVAVFVALPFLAVDWQLPEVVTGTLGYLSQSATPLGLLAIGGLMDVQGARSRLRPALFAVTIKNLAYPLLAVLAAHGMGFGGEDLLIVFVTAASPTAVSSFSTAQAMGGDGPLAANILIVSTFVSAFVLAGGIYLLRVLAWI